MKSKYEHLKTEGIQLRKEGASLKDIRSSLDIPLSTLSGWLRNIEIAPEYVEKLKARHAAALITARSKAAEAHKRAKELRVQNLKDKVDEEYGELDVSSRSTLEIALAMLYLGEGSKGKHGLSLGNSSPMIIQFYINSLNRLYGISPSSLGAELHLRADQNEIELKEFWSKVTGIPLEKFTYVYKDERTRGRPTYPEYKGVCNVSGGGVEIQRRLMYLAEVFCNRNMGD